MEMDDNEDGIIEEKKDSVSAIERKVKKKKKKKDEQGIELNPEFQEHVEFILNDFKNYLLLKTFKNMKSLSLIGQYIKSIDPLICCDIVMNLEALNLNENEIASMKPCEKLKNLKELHLNFNLIEKIEGISESKNLEVLWLSENKISVIEGLPANLKRLNLASNLIEKLEENILDLQNIEEINFSANFFIDLKDILTLSKLPKLAKLFYQDISYGECPMYTLNNYRIFVLHHIPQLEQLDGINILPEERKEVVSIYSKKFTYYSIKIKALNCFSKTLFEILKTFKSFFSLFKNLQILFFNKRIKMLDYIEYDRKYLNQGQNVEEELLDDIEKEKENSKDKLKKCHKNTDVINLSYTKIKDFISDLNDFMIVNNFYELESSGNFKLEPASLKDKWANSCIELIKNRTSNKYFTSANNKNFNIMKIWKIHNKKHKYLFDSLYENLMEMSGKWGEDRKYYDFLFLHSEHKDYEDIIKNLYNCFDNSENLVLSNYIDKIEEYKHFKNISNSGNKSVNSFVVICKTVNIDSIFTDVLKIIDNNTTLAEIISILNKEQFDNMNKILRLCDEEREQKFYLFKNKFLLLPEFFLEYNVNNPMNISTNENYLISSFSNKTEIKPDLIDTFNSCLRHLTESSLVKNFVEESFLSKFRFCKSVNFEEIDTNSLFFAKASLNKFLNKCFKYLNVEEYMNEFNKIYEKVEEINTINVSHILMNEQTIALQISKVKFINLYNCNIHTLEPNIVKFFTEAESLNLSNNLLVSFDAELLGPSIKNLDLSNNQLKEIVNVSKENMQRIVNLDISFNELSDVALIYFIVKYCDSLKSLNVICNPFPTKLFSQLNMDSFTVLDPAFSSRIEEFFNQKKATEQEEMLLDNKPFTPEISDNVVLSQIKENELIMSLKRFDIVYDNYSFTDKYASFSNQEIFQEKQEKDIIKEVLILSKKKLKKIPKINLHDCGRPFKVLYLNLNKISHFSNLEMLKNTLTEIHIQGNKIQSLENLENQCLSSLLKLDIANNQLVNLEGIESLISLVHLNIENNNINSLRGLEYLENLTELLAASNKLSNLKDCNELRKNKKLNVLDLSFNEMAKSNEFRFFVIFYNNNLKILNKVSVEKVEITNAKNFFEGRITSELLESKLGSDNTLDLIEADLSNCKLKDLENIFTSLSFPKLKKLNISRNMFSSFKIFGNCPALQDLNISHNLFERFMGKLERTVNGKGLMGLLSIEILEMSNNILTDMTGIQMLKNLRNATFRDNNINKMDFFDGLPNLQFLDLNNNKLRNIEKSNIGLLPSLKVLILDNNYIKNANPFKKLANLSFLSFENNKITEITQVERLGDLEYLREVSFANNPFIKMYCYRLQIIKRMPGLVKLDGYEVSNEEREIIRSEFTSNSSQPININSINQVASMLPDNRSQQLGSYFTGNPLVINNIGSSAVSSIPMTSQNARDYQAVNQDKAHKEKYNNMKVNYINLDLLNAQKNMRNDLWEDTPIRDGVNSSSNLPRIDLQLQIGNFNNQGNKRENKAMSSNKVTYRSSKVKINNIPLGNLFKHIGEVISSSNEGLNTIVNKISKKDTSKDIASFSENDKRNRMNLKSRPLSNALRKNNQDR